MVTSSRLRSAVVAMRLQRFALLGLELAGAREQVVEAAVLRDEIDRALLADARNARHVVAGVADEREHVGHLIRLDAELLHDAALVEPRAVFARIVDANARPHQLKEVLVDRDDGDVEAAVAGPEGERADHVVGLVAGGGDDRDAERFARLVHPLDLLGEIVGHGRARRLVVVDELVAKRRTREIERRREIGRRVVLDQLSQHRHEDVDGVRRLPFLIRQAAPAKRVIRAVHLAAAVDQEERAGIRHGGTDQYTES